MPDQLLPVIPPEAPCETNNLTIAAPEFERPPDPQLVAEGWERRFMADSLRVREYVELYTGLGFEVRLEKVGVDEVGPECGDCRLVICRQFLTVYTRRPATASAPGG